MRPHRIWKEDPPTVPPYYGGPLAVLVVRAPELKLLGLGFDSLEDHFLYEFYVSYSDSYFFYASSGPAPPLMNGRVH